MRLRLFARIFYLAVFCGRLIASDGEVYAGSGSAPEATNGVKNAQGSTGHGSQFVLGYRYANLEPEGLVFALEAVRLEYNYQSTQGDWIQLRALGVQGLLASGYAIDEQAQIDLGVLLGTGGFQYNGYNQDGGWYRVGARLSTHYYIEDLSLSIAGEFGLFAYKDVISARGASLVGTLGYRF